MYDITSSIKCRCYSVKFEAPPTVYEAKTSMQSPSVLTEQCIKLVVSSHAKVFLSFFFFFFFFFFSFLPNFSMNIVMQKKKIDKRGL